ncbi:MAG: hypothetical protein M3512_06265 [Bacteroidota bacterium]|nr:hypothetical protein [Bacteroidota bacterium]
MHTTVLLLKAYIGRFMRISSIMALRIFSLPNLAFTTRLISLTGLGSENCFIFSFCSYLKFKVDKWGTIVMPAFRSSSLINVSILLASYCMWLLNISFFRKSNILKTWFLKQCPF